MAPILLNSSPLPFRPVLLRAYKIPRLPSPPVSFANPILSPSLPTPQDDLDFIISQNISFLPQSLFGNPL
jgi:hypothetical protein